MGRLGVALRCASIMFARPVLADEAEAHYRLAIALRGEGKYDPAAAERAQRAITNLEKK